VNNKELSKLVGLVEGWSNRTYKGESEIWDKASVELNKVINSCFNDFNIVSPEFPTVKDRIEALEGQLAAAILGNDIDTDLCNELLKDYAERNGI
jgi:hypothetical protein